MRQTRWILNLVLVLLLALSIGCGDDDGYEEPATGGGDGGSPSFPGQTFTGSATGEGFSEPFRSGGGDVEVSITHDADSRIIIHIVRMEDGEVWETIVYMDPVTEGKSTLYLPPGDFYIDVVAAAGESWTVDITGNIQTYGTPPTYSGCGPQCCIGNGGVAGCDCETGWCRCTDGSLSDNCQCRCEEDTETSEDGEGQTTTPSDEA